MSAEDDDDEAARDETEGEAPSGSHDRASPEPEPTPEPEPEAARPVGAAGEPPPGRRRISLWWLLPVAMVVEFWVYGHNGYIDVCVGKEGHTDFTLKDQARTDENRWKFPRCERRTNLGLRSHYDERVEEATKVACRGATLFRFQGEAKACEAGESGWTREVTSRFTPPWDPAYYEHLFWFLK
jgi:hypothetical protein